MNASINSLSDFNSSKKGTFISNTKSVNATANTPSLIAMMRSVLCPAI
jgi:hypothetical protein